MTEFSKKWTPKGFSPGGGRSVSDLFSAAYELDIDKIQAILESGDIDVNSVYSYGQTRSSERPAEHMLQSFESSMSGRVTCQIFENIDHAQELDVKVILHLLQLLVRKGLILEKVIFDRRNNEFSDEASNHFWFTVLRKLYIYSCDPTKDASHQTAYKSVASYLEETLFKEDDQYGQIARTTRLFLAVEEGDFGTVEGLLEQFQNKSHFLTYMRRIPGKIFPIGSFTDEIILVTPVVLSLRQRNVRMLNLLCRFNWGKQPMFKMKTMEASRKMRVTLFLDILREDEQFFENPDLPNLQDQNSNNSVVHWTGTTDSSVNVARVFRAVEMNNIERVKELLSNASFLFLQSVKDTYITSRSPLIGEQSLDRIWITKLYFDKSLVLIALENKNMEIFEYLEDNGFDLTDLGKEAQYPSNSRERNKLFLWYLVIRYHLQENNYNFVYQLTQKQKIWQGPALVGCLFMAARREDLSTMKLISKYFDSTWFTGPKYMDLTAHGLLVKHGLEKEATLLMTYLGPQFATQSQADIERELNNAESLEDFKKLIEENPQWLTRGFVGHKSLVMIFVTSLRFSTEKFEFLVREKEADIHMVSTERKTFLDYMLDLCYINDSCAERLLDVMQYEEAHVVLLLTPNFLSDLSKNILKASAPVKVILLECFKMVVQLSSQTLEIMFFPKQAGGLDKGGTSIFELINDDEDLFEVASERAFQLIGKEENKMAALVHLLRVHVKGMFRACSNTTKLDKEQEKKMLALFKMFLENLHLKSKQEESGYTAGLEDWRDRYGMTFLMRLLVDNADKSDSWAPAVDLLIQKIIEGEFFDDEYIDTKAEVDLNSQFDLQHRLGITSVNKKKNTVLSDNQLIPVKRVERLNVETGQYEPIVPDKDNQIKMISRERIKVRNDGSERKTRVMVTVKDADVALQEEPESEEMNDDDYTVDEEPFDFDAVSIDGDESDDGCSENRPILDLSEDELPTRIERWTMGQDEIKERIVEPEHFDKTSILTKSNETFMTKENKYKYAKSASTRFIETHSEVEAPSKHFSKKTTLLLLACRTNKWSIAESIIDVYTLLTDVNYKDSKGSNALHLAIKADQADICKEMIEKIDTRGLKAEVNADGKNALMLVTEMIKEECLEFEIVEKKILQKTGQKKNPYRNSTPEVIVDKSQDQTLRLFRGQSCGFNFECLEPPMWTCRGGNCAVDVSVGDDFTMEDKDHYNRHTCNTDVKVKHKKGKIHIDQFKFICLDDSESEEDEDDVVEVWKCTGKGCNSILKVNGETNLVEAHRPHTCQTSLKMEVDKMYGMLDSYVFCKDPGGEGQRSTWHCDDKGCKGEKKGCKITATENELKLEYPHTSGMHRCKDYTQTSSNAEEEGPVEEEEEDEGGLFGLFD